MAKTCNRCELLKPLEDFSVHQSNKGGYATICKACVVQRNKEYWRTPPGRISQIYAVECVTSRQRGHTPPEYTQKELYNWAVKNGLFLLADKWRESGYEKNLSPSVDRVDSTQGYSFPNIRLVTWEQNNDQAYEDRKLCIRITKQNRKVEQLTLEGVHVAFYDSIAAAGRATGVQRTNINAMCKGKPQYKSVGGFLWRHI